ncbi:MAG: glycosyltransferase family 2 protein, partial [Gemmatimonadota bacterium]
MTESNAPLLSVGLPVWNGLPYLEETLRSILNSEFQDYEIIVCDNASTDGTPELLAEYAAREPRIRFVRNETNIGAARNYNLTFELARGRYFRWMASDDLHSPGAIARCI